MVGFEGPELPDRVHRSLAGGELGGIILFKRNIESAAAVHRMLRSLTWPEGLPPLVGVDQEGGRVARLGEPLVTLPAMRSVGDGLDPAAIRTLGVALGRQLAALGFTMDFAPVLDIDSNPDNPVIGDRAFGDTAEAVAARALPFAAGLAEGGVLPCGKHFPGHGDTDLDSHLALPRLAHERSRLDAVELAPFRAAIAAGIPALMSAHVRFDTLDPAVPATLSKAVMTDLLRGELGFEGAIISDDLEMKAVADAWGVVPSGVRAIEAGCDILLVCSDLDAAYATRDALAARAAVDDAFAARLQDACERALTLRRKQPPKPASTLDESIFAVDEPVRMALAEVSR